MDFYSAYTGPQLAQSSQHLAVPYFGTRAMPDYHPKMVDIAEQLMDKWDLYWLLGSSVQKLAF